MITITISEPDKQKNKAENEKEEEDDGVSLGSNDSNYTGSESEYGSKSETEVEPEIDQETRIKIKKECEEMIENMSNFKKLVLMGEYYSENKDTMKYILENEQLEYFKKCFRIKPYIIQLMNMVGLETCKKTIFLQVSYFLQGLHEDKLDMLHMVISGQPGVGKTQLAKIIGKLYSKLGILKYGQFIHAKRSDLIGQHLGETSIKTSQVLEDAYGGILFIDEAYSLGNEEKRDIFSKECIDTINQSMTENKNYFMLIIAGYKQSLLDCFFNYNPGLKRRFNFWIHIPNYNARQLHQIFVEKFDIDTHSDWKINSPVKKHAPLPFFSKNYNHFQNFGGDIESLIFYIKLFHSTNIKKGKKKKSICYNDLLGGFELFKENRQVDNSRSDIINSLYI